MDTFIKQLEMMRVKLLLPLMYMREGVVTEESSIICTVICFL